MSPYQFLESIESLKNLDRSGWVLKGVPSPECVAGHMYRMAFDEETRARAEFLALVHDMAEAVVGDITPHDGVSKEQKYIREDMGMKYLSCTIRDENPTYADQILEAWDEYEKGTSRAACLVRQLDKLECLDQAVLYQERWGIDLEEFMSQKDQITLPELSGWLDTRLRDYESLKARKNANVVVVFVSGGPGVGKGTQCARVASAFDFRHISVGDLLRAEAKSPTSPFREFIEESFRKSILIPAQFSTFLLKREIGNALANGERKFLLDGFPRDLNQVTDFEKKICARHFTISMNCSEEEMRRRLKARAETSDRVDANPETTLKRARTFNENNMPVLEYLQKKGKLYSIDCSASIDDVYDLMQNQIKEILEETDSSGQDLPLDARK